MPDGKNVCRWACEPHNLLCPAGFLMFSSVLVPMRDRRAGRAARSRRRSAVGSEGASAIVGTEVDRSAQRGGRHVHGPTDAPGHLRHGGPGAGVLTWAFRALLFSDLRERSFQCLSEQYRLVSLELPSRSPGGAAGPAPARRRSPATLGCRGAVSGWGRGAMAGSGGHGVASRAKGTSTCPLPEHSHGAAEQQREPLRDNGPADRGQAGRLRRSPAAGRSATAAPTPP